MYATTRKHGVEEFFTDLQQIHLSIMLGTGKGTVKVKIESHPDPDLPGEVVYRLRTEAGEEKQYEFTLRQLGELIEANESDQYGRRLIAMR